MKTTRKRYIKKGKTYKLARKTKVNGKDIIQSGGLKLGQGTFGCVITPAIKCPNSKIILPTKQAISKIIYRDPKYKDKYDREISILRKIAEIDKKQHYLIGVLDECELDISEIKKRKVKDTAIVNFTDQTRNNWLLSDKSSSNIGKLSQGEIKNNYCLIDPKLNPRNQIQINGGSQFDSFLTSKYSRNFGIVRRYYLNIIKDILIGIKLLHSHRIAHRDIKDSNMVCQIIPLNRKNKPNDFYPVVRHIDFGLAEIVEPGKKYDLFGGVRYAGTHTFIPPDLHLIRSRFICMFKEAIGKSNTIPSKNNQEQTIQLEKLLIPATKKKIIDELHFDLTTKSYKDFPILNITPQMGLGHTATNTDSVAFISKESLAALYDSILSSLMDTSFSKKYSTDYDGIVYKTDIFAAGVAIARIRYYLQITNPKLLDLIGNMVRIDPNNRFNINQCLAHPVFK